MRDPCSVVEETIWDCAREGLELPEDAARHVSTCESCARTFRLVRPSLSLLQKAGRVETAVDRSVIIARLTPRSARVASKWGIGLAVMALTIPALIGLKVATIRPPMPRQAPVVARRNPPPSPRPRKNEPAKTAYTPAPSHKEKVTGQRLHIRRLRKPSVKRIAGRPQKAEPVKERTVVSAASHQPDQRVQDRMDEHPTGNRPIAAVSVTWNVALHNKDVSYQYHDTDPNTGTVIEGTVKRTGNNIEIHLESKPEETPGKGEIDNETNPDA